MGRPRKIVQVNLEDLSSDVSNFILNNKKDSIKSLTGRYINHFSEDTYEASLVSAFEWIDGQNKKHPNQTYVAVDYYPQILGNKAVLLSYNVVSKEKE